MPWYDKEQFGERDADAEKEAADARELKLGSTRRYGQPVARTFRDKVRNPEAAKFLERIREAQRNTEAPQAAQRVAGLMHTARHLFSDLFDPDRKLAPEEAALVQAVDDYESFGTRGPR